jgi:2-polyprenyl-3-methyl-5-hydroxy-6-metoxy-1,4-benzoquinol methylase
MKPDDTLSYYGKLASMYYDAMEAFAPESEVSFYAQKIDANPGRVLEAMSGSGRLQIPLLTQGYSVDGVDSSADMLNRCRIRAIEHNVIPNLYEQRLENLTTEHTYATVIIPFASFQLIVDRNDAFKALCKIREYMIQGGHLLIDVFTPNIAPDERSISTARIDTHTVIRLTTRYLHNKEKRCVEALRCYQLIKNGTVQEQENELIQLTWYTDEELANLLLCAGFQVIQIHTQEFRSSGPSTIVEAHAI